MEELIKFLNKYGFDNTHYDIIDDRLVIKDDYILLDNHGITKLPDSFYKLKVDTIWLDNNLLTELPNRMKDIKVEDIYLYNNCLTEIELSNDIGYLCCDKSVIIKGDYPNEIRMV